MTDKTNPQIYGSYIHVNEAWYALVGRWGDVTAEVNIMWNDTPEYDGGMLAECAVRWYDLGDGPPVPRLEVYSDACAMLALAPDLLGVLAETGGRSPTPAQFCAALDGIGYTDVTPRTDPYVTDGALTPTT